MTRHSLPQIIRRALMAIFVAGALLVLAGSDLLRPLDRTLADWRFSFEAQPATGQTVFVDIDAQALEHVGVWPWPRSVHAQVIDRLIELGAYDVWLDVDFSSASAPAEDAALAEALRSAGGYAYLAAFQRAGESQSSGLALPLPRFLAHADPFAVNVLTDDAGIVRTVPDMVADGDRAVGSLAALLYGRQKPGAIAIDYGIDADTVPKISVAAVLEGTADPSLIEDRHVVVGASALELWDFFFTPNQGPLPGALIQILAAETAAAERSLVLLDQGWAIGALMLVLLVHTALPVRGVVARSGLLLTAAVAFEAVAADLYLSGAKVLPSATFHAGVGILMLLTLMQDTQLLSRLVSRIGRERDALKAMLEQVIEDNYDGVVIITPSGTVVAASRFATEFLGRDLVGSQMTEFLPGPIAVDVASAMEASGAQSTSGRGQTVALSASGRRHIEYVATRSSYGEHNTAVVTVTFRDITDRLRHEKQLAYLAEHDPVTGVLSRPGLIKRLETASAAADAGAPAVLVLEVERFKAITATLGHEAGDELLRQVARRLEDARLGPVAHLGQAQFAVATDGTRDPATCFDGIRRLVATTFEISGHSATVGLRAGYAAQREGEEAPEILRRAEAALISAQGGAGSRLAIYDDEAASRLARSRRIEGQLVKALETRQFFLLYQPQYDLRTGAVIGAEALVRWQHEDKIVPPNEFLPIAEQTGLIVDMTRWILTEACKTAARWPEGIRVAVNISALHFELGDLVADVKAALDQSGLPAHALELEITESVTVQLREQVSAMLGQLRRMGVTVAIDDFGTGYSSLAYLDRLPFDVLKIDKSFVDTLRDPDGDDGVIASIVGLGKTLGKKILAEGIEDGQQAEHLRQLGCDLAQGYHFARPMQASAFAAELRNAA